MQVTADLLDQLPTLDYKPVSSGTWQAIQHSKLNLLHRIINQDGWEEADLPIGTSARDGLKSADTDTIERFGYFSHLIDVKYPKQYSSLTDYKNGRVIIVRPAEKKMAASFLAKVEAAQAQAVSVTAWEKLMSKLATDSHNLYNEIKSLSDGLKKAGNPLMSHKTNLALSLMINNVDYMGKVLDSVKKLQAKE